MNLFTGVESTALFGGEVPPAVRRLIDSARGASRAETGAILWTAVLTSPQSLPPYYLLYKFHASQGELDEAHEVACKALAVAARQASIDSDWREVQPGDADFATPGPARFWLFTLKALGFISVRRGERAVAHELVGKLRMLDPADGVGYGVVEALLS
ncbi:hypothetical protein [Paraburkholderia caballeronis]|uniref:Tetratricopeptide repeat-containing protein n=1 Tax=Paraburkholderia caballeronis TaxID=416943 RepID=A0A1H7FGN6_9BURK|nr:hypothetical protein [Paraburkholderia caballeronis]PXW24024.1 hypothetical protein C7403_108183 [Paraburkholderia caballeronis]PXW99788.1 hypothetical protein C7407_108183 [Paraburkholderia caballeronis]RAJ96742.1 hypothetical protein C7409_108183 [Paraburkholderia caballeronis]TDV15774.1 hypothetical protein C7408_106231 [Paraburkholderia caballeronis]TDV18029.1 hypothetical protein C7406_105231 [Paraburkholderia caballeronis]